MSDTPITCPCLSGKSYSLCCEPLHNKSLTANSAEQLMCSRYSAFYLAKVDYLIATLHPDKRQLDEHQLLQETIEQTSWLGLQIVKHNQRGNTATVEFIAFYQDENIEQLHERSNFVRQDNQWFYVDGQFLPAVKLGRNQNCFCGSGKKLKRCHSATN
ncbi:YchJ family protein [Pseudomonadota bacterium]|nr:YchJ family protein [Pseudomonadota bacterium]